METLNANVKRSICFILCSMIAVGMVPAFAGGAELVSWQQLSTITGAIPAPANNRGEAASLVLDIDKDGINDFVIVSWDSSEPVAWYRRGATGWTKYLIDATTQNIEAGGTFLDVDNDGDLDVVLGDSWLGNCIYWWENPYPNFGPKIPWTRHLIKNTGTYNHHDMMFADVDGDGQIEFLSWNGNPGNMLLMFDIPANPRTSGVWPMQTIYSSGNTGREGLVAADINGDGKAEIIGGGIWLEHTNGTNFTPHIIDNAMGISRCAVGYLITGSTYPQVVLCPGDADGPAKWYQWNGTGSAWQSHTLLPSVIHGHSLALADINGDGHLDVFIGEMAKWGNSAPENPNAKVRALYGDGTGNFTEQVVMTGQGVHESTAADMDGDGKIDILGKPFIQNIPRLYLWLNNPVGDLNNDGSVDMNDLPFFIAQWLNSDCAAPLWCDGSDLNKDGRVDFLDYAMLAGHWQ